MKFTLAWLKDHLETKASLTEITDKLTAIGLELEGVEDRATELAAFTVGYVTEAKQHPNADRLRLCIVDTGTERVQVVCGAPNARTGMKGVFAPSGTTIPGTGMVLKPSKIRGEDSNGMLCSEREMGLSDEHDGIIVLPEDAALGAPFAAYIARLSRTGMLEVLSQDHIRTAHAKGLPPKLVLLRHAIKGGLLPVVSYLGPATAGILTGSLVIERIFAIPGTGSHFVNSALNRDYTLSMGVTILYTVLVYGLNTVVDLAYTFLDPRIKLEDS